MGCARPYQKLPSQVGVISRSPLPDPRRFMANPIAATHFSIGPRLLQRQAALDQRQELKLTLVSTDL